MPSYSESGYALLALCARAQGHPTQYQHLREQAANPIFRKMKKIGQIGAACPPRPKLMV